MAAALECWSGRPSTDEDMVEQVLMKTHDRSEAFPSSSSSSSSSSSPPSSSSSSSSSSTTSSSSSSSSSSTSSSSSSSSSSSTTTTTNSLQQKKWQQRLGRNFAGAISSLKSSFNLDNLRDQIASAKSLSNKDSKLPWSIVVRNLTQLYPGNQLPDQLLSTIRRHFESLPNSYAQAGHDTKEVLLHVRLVEQATAEGHPAVHVEELPERPSEKGTLFRLTFASAAAVSLSSMSGTLDAIAATCKKIQIYERKGLTLGVVNLLVNPGGERLFKSRAEEAVRSAVKRPPSPKNVGVNLLPFGGLCGCQDAEDSGSCKHGNENHHRPLPESTLVVSVDEWQCVRSGLGEDMGKWLLSSAEIEIVEKVGSNAFKGVYKGRKVWVKKVRGCERGCPYEVEVRKDLLELMSRGHRCVLQLQGLCLEEAQGLCVVSRMMEGGSLHDVLSLGRKKSGGRREGAPLPAREVWRVALDVAEGLMFMNDHGVAYTDLNARRILLDRDGNACLGDMGAIAVRARSNTSFSDVPTEYETAGYRWLAPEMIAGDPETVSETWMSNVYSLGMVIWEMLTGDAAYGSYSPVQAAVGIAACGLRPEIPKDCPPALRSLLTKCWNSNPCKRPKLPEVVALLSKQTSR